MGALQLDTDKNGTKWFDISGFDYGTELEFYHDVFGLTDNNGVVDCDNVLLSETDSMAIAVRNLIN